jgi:hypothetical protein
MLASAPHRTHAAAESHIRELLTMAAADRRATPVPVTAMRPRPQRVARAWRSWRSAPLVSWGGRRTAGKCAAKTAPSI